MNFNFRGFDSQREHNPLFPASSSFFSDQPITGVWPTVRSVGLVVDTREAIDREIVKERIRSEILAEEIARLRLRIEMMEQDTMVMHNNGGFTSRYMFGPPPFRKHQNNWFEPESNVHGGLFSPEDKRRIMSSHEIHRGSDGSYGRDIGGFEMVPFQQGRSHSPNIKEVTTYQLKDVTKEVIRLGQPFGAPVSGLKRKLPPSRSAGECSSELCSDPSNKRIRVEWSCAVCQISTSSEQSLNDHLAGKKHQSKMAVLNGSKNGCEIGLGKIKNSDNKQPLEIKNSAKCVSFYSKEDQKTERENTKPKLKPWCKMCQVEASNEKNMIQHKEGKQHMKNLLKRARTKNRN